MAMTATGVFVIDATRLGLTEQESALISEALAKTMMAEVTKLDKSIPRPIDLDKVEDPLVAARGFGGMAGMVIHEA